jgi:hypothetical protein
MSDACDAWQSKSGWFDPQVLTAIRDIVRNKIMLQSGRAGKEIKLQDFAEIGEDDEVDEEEENEEENIGDGDAEDSMQLDEEEPEGTDSALESSNLALSDDVGQRVSSKVMLPIYSMSLSTDTRFDR